MSSTCIHGKRCRETDRIEEDNNAYTPPMSIHIHVSLSLSVYDPIGLRTAL